MNKSDLPRPVVKRMRWPFPWVWIVPVLALVGTGIYFWEDQKGHGPEVVVRMADASGIRAADTKVQHRGVEIGSVEGVELSQDQREARVRIRLLRSADMYAKEGAEYWVVRPEISVGSITGLSTVLTGPYLSARPGTGPTTREFLGLAQPPLPKEEGLTIVLHTPKLEHVQVGSGVSYRGIQVGEVRELRLGGDAESVEVQVFIRHRYAALVRRNSQFWAVSGADVKGGVFSGIEIKLGSIKTLISGGVAFATPDDPLKDVARDGDEFTLHDEAKKEWMDWSPRIALELGRHEDVPGPE